MKASLTVRRLFRSSRSDSKDVNVESNAKSVTTTGNESQIHDERNDPSASKTRTNGRIRSWWRQVRNETKHDGDMQVSERRRSKLDRRPVSIQSTKLTDSSAHLQKQVQTTPPASPPSTLREDLDRSQSRRASTQTSRPLSSGNHLTNWSESTIGLAQHDESTELPHELIGVTTSVLGPSTSSVITTSVSTLEEGRSQVNSKLSPDTATTVDTKVVHKAINYKKPDSTLPEIPDETGDSRTLPLSRDRRSSRFSSTTATSLSPSFSELPQEKPDLLSMTSQEGGESGDMPTSQPQVKSFSVTKNASESTVIGQEFNNISVHPKLPKTPSDAPPIQPIVANSVVIDPVPTLPLPHPQLLPHTSNVQSPTSNILYAQKDQPLSKSATQLPLLQAIPEPTEIPNNAADETFKQAVAAKPSLSSIDQKDESTKVSSIVKPVEVNPPSSPIDWENDTDKESVHSNHGTRGIATETSTQVMEATTLDESIEQTLTEPLLPSADQKDDLAKASISLDHDADILAPDTSEYTAIDFAHETYSRDPTVEQSLSSIDGSGESVEENVVAVSTNEQSRDSSLLLSSGIYQINNASQEDTRLEKSIVSDTVSFNSLLDGERGSVMYQEILLPLKLQSETTPRVDESQPVHVSKNTRQEEITSMTRKHASPPIPMHAAVEMVLVIWAYTLMAILFFQLLCSSVSISYGLAEQIGGLAWNAFVAFVQLFYHE